MMPSSSSSREESKIHSSISNLEAPYNALHEYEEETLRNIFNQLAGPTEPKLISKDTFLDFIKIDRNFGSCLYQSIAHTITTDKQEITGISFENLKDALFCIFEPYWTTPKEAGLTSPPPKPRTKRSFSFSRHYRVDRRNILVYLYVASLETFSPNEISDFRKIDRLSRDLEWETKDLIQISKKQVQLLLKTVFNIAVNELIRLNPQAKFSVGFDGVTRQRCPNEDFISHMVEQIFQTPNLTASFSPSSAERPNLIKSDCISFRDIFDWFQRHNSSFFNPLDVHLYRIFMAGSASSKRVYRGPLSTIPKYSISSAFLSVEELALLSGSLPISYLRTHHCGQEDDVEGRHALHPSWTMLFNTEDQGHSMKQFEYHLYDYPGNTLLLIHAETKPEGKTVILASYVSVPWKPRKTTWGDESCFLMELCPSIELFPTVRKNSHSGVYDNVFLSSNFGIGFGGTQSSGFMLSLDSYFMKGKYGSATTNFCPFASSRYRTFHHDLEVIRIEAYGLAGDKAFKLWKKEKQFAAMSAEQRQNVNIGHDKDVDKIILEMAGREFHDDQQEKQH